MCRGPANQGAAEEGLPETQVVPTIKEKDILTTDEKPALDSPRSWFVCDICTLALCGAAVGFRCSGLLLVSIAEEFDVPRGQASWPSSIVNLMMLFCGEFQNLGSIEPGPQSNSSRDGREHIRLVEVD